MTPFRTVDVSDPRFENEGLRQVTVKSAALRGRGDLTVWAPAEGVPKALVILLHGVYGSHWGWAMRGGAHRTAAGLIANGDIPPLALAMPSDGLRGDGTGYLRHGDGTDFERWIVDEVAEATCLALPELSPDAPRFIAGLSMGAFGALRLGGRYAPRFRGISAHSAITDVAQMGLFIEEEFATFGTAAADGSALAAIVAAGANLPPLRLDCGVDDDLIEPNRELHRALAALGIPHVYEEFPGGHTWPYWEVHLAETLRFFGKVLRQ